MRTTIRVCAAAAALVLAWIMPAQAQPHDYLTIGLASFPASIHPLVSSSGDRSYVLASIRRSVTRYDANGRVMCQLCAELPSVENGGVTLFDQADGTKGMDVTFTLRAGLRWGDGTPLTTKDILFGYELERVFNPRTNLIGVTALDDRRFTMKFKAPRFDYQSLAPQPINAAIEEPLLRAAKDVRDYPARSAFNLAPTTPGLWNGPYLITDLIPNESVTLAPNPYWDGEKPAFRQVTLRLIGNSAARQADLVSSDVDVANGLSFDQSIDLQKRYPDRFDVAFTPSLSITWLLLQNDNPLLADKRVRQAMMLAIDRQEIVTRLFDGKLPVATSIWPRIDPTFDPDLKPWPYDPARARALLAEAGFAAGSDGVMQRPDGTRLSLDFIISAGFQTSELLQQAVQSQLKQVGIETVARAEPYSVLWGSQMHRREFSGIVLASDSHSPGIIPWNQFATGGIPRESNAFSGQNYVGYSNPRLDAELSAAYAVIDPAKRKAMLDDIQVTIMDDLPKIPLYDGANVYVSPKWLTGLTPPRSTDGATLWIEYWKARG